MQKKVDLSTCQGHLVEVVLERIDERQPWSLAVRVREAEGGDWSADLWVADRRDYFTCYDALAACKARALQVIDGRRQARAG
jgi:hypothetical protein